ncbi:hypothetical protein MXD63_03020, partial [Frankia sp. Cpl3]|nr:hypothetical protein [Frankia sp. Cpl3]
VTVLSEAGRSGSNGRVDVGTAGPGWPQGVAARRVDVGGVEGAAMGGAGGPLVPPIAEGCGSSGR